jgi:hypothetical protein
MMHSLAYIVTSHCMRAVQHAVGHCFVGAAPQLQQHFSCTEALYTVHWQLALALYTDSHICAYSHSVAPCVVDSEAKATAVSTHSVLHCVACIYMACMHAWVTPAAMDECGDLKWWCEGNQAQHQHPGWCTCRTAAAAVGRTSAWHGCWVFVRGLQH